MEAVKILHSESIPQATHSNHRAPTGDLATSINVAGYLETIAKEIISGLSVTEKIRIEADLSCRFLLPLEKAIPLGIIIGELVTNSIKYAHPTGIAGVVRIESARRVGAIVIEVSDDGVGLPEGLDPLATDDPGLAMVRALAARVGASISFSSHGLGLSCALSMPYAELRGGAL